MHHRFITLRYGYFIFLRYYLRDPPVTNSVTNTTSSLLDFNHALLNFKIFGCYNFFNIAISSVILYRSLLLKLPSLILLHAISQPDSLSYPLYTVLYAPQPRTSLYRKNLPFGDRSAISSLLSSSDSSLQRDSDFILMVLITKPRLKIL